MRPLREVLGLSVTRERDEDNDTFYEDEDEAGDANTRNENMKTTRSFTSRQRDVLKKWFDEHYHCPRPTPKEKTVLCRQTSLTLRQLNDWFSNQRRRHWKR
jgi:hypothetical protein